MTRRSSCLCGLILFILLGVVPVMGALPQPPPDYLQPEKGWIKEDGLPPETWNQYNDTGSNKLNLTNRHSAVNMAYVIRSSNPDDEVNTTFIVYKNESASNGFNSTGHLFDGSTPVQTLRYQLTGRIEGEFMYHLIIATFDPGGDPGIYQIRINVTGTLSGGSNWTHPNGNPNVPWMFFEVPAGASWPVSVRDQLGRFSPFFLDTPIPSTSLEVQFVVAPPGNDTGVSVAHVDWNHTNGTTIAEFDVPIYYVAQGRWAAGSTIAVDDGTFPQNTTHPYMVGITLGHYKGSSQFFVYPLDAAHRPDTELTDRPPSVSTNANVSFAWVGSDLDGSVTGFDYRMDSDAWVSTSERNGTFKGLANGTHTFQVRAVDDDGLVDPVPASWGFTLLINSPPDTEIITAPNATTIERDIFFEWQGSDVDGTVASYEYRLDGGSWANTTYANTTFYNVSSGTHTFQARSIDDQGLCDPTPAESTFTIPPTWCETQLEQLNAFIGTLQQRIDELEISIANLAELLVEAGEENAALQEAIDILQNEKEGLLSLVRHLGDEKLELLERIFNLSARNEELEEDLGICGNLTGILQSQIQQLDHTISELMAKNEELEAGNENLLQLVEQLRERIRELESQIPEMSTFGLGAVILMAVWAAVRSKMHA